MTLIDTDRVIARPDTSATLGRIVWAPVKSLWLTAHMAGGLAALILFPSWGGLAAFLGLAAITLCAGHSVGMHRLLDPSQFRDAALARASSSSGLAPWWAWPDRSA